MTPERFQQIDRLVDLALDQKGGERDAFLDTACAGDPELRREVESLLASDQRAGRFLQGTAGPAAADLLNDGSLAEDGRSTVPPPRALGRYRVLNEIGRGGMGVVYRAEDPELARTVAIKLLRPESVGDLSATEARARLMREAQAMARISHPNVNTVYDVATFGEQVFIAMEYIEGPTLRVWLADHVRPWREVLDIFVQAGRGLAAAHAGGILHRDFKPENVLVDAQGRARVVDFGLARTAEANRQQEATNARAVPEGQSSAPVGMLGVTLTQRGKLFGTPAYMAPEQLRGERADAKTDQYSFCVALFQGLYGRLPFTAESPDALLRQIEQRTVASPSNPSHVPSSIHKVLLRGLSPAREDRYESLDALLRDLTRLPAKRLKPSAVILLASILMLGIILTGTLAAGLWRARERSPLAKGGNPPAVTSLAVLPLENQTGDAGQEFFVDGMTDALITRLAQVSALQVTSKQSVLRYKTGKKPLPTIARELGVGAVVTGSVARSGNQVHIDAQLVDAASSRRLWSRSYDRDLSEVSVLQSEIAGSIAEEIKAKMTPLEQARLAKARAVNPAAYEAYLQGRFLVSRHSVEEATKSLKYFQQAIDIDPDYAPAYAGLCESYENISQFSGPKREAWEKGKAAANRALELDETLAEAHRCRARGLRAHEWDWVESEKEYQRALQLNPGDPDTYRSYSVPLALTGRANEAIAVSKRALELDPLSAQSAVAVAFSYYFARQYDRTVEQARRAVELDPTLIQGHRWLGLGYAEKGKFPEAIDEFKLTVKLSPGNLSYLTNLAYLYAWAGKETEARQTLAQVRELSKTQFMEAWPIGLTYVALGDKDEAFAWMDKAYEERSAWLLSLGVNPWVDPLRSDPRFDELVRRVEAMAKLTQTSRDSFAR